MFRSHHSCRFLVAGAFLLAGPILSARADQQAVIKAEADFASGLVDLRFPDYAQKVLNKLTADFGNAAKTHVSRVRIKIMTARGDFSAAKDEVGKMSSDNPETMVMRLTLADQLYTWNKLVDARELYDSFFKKYPQGPPTELQEFYGESAYRYAQMLKRVGDYTNAIQAYRYVLLAVTNGESDLPLQIKTEMSELIVQAAPKLPEATRTELLAEARTKAEEVQWVGQGNIWFWRTVVVLAHIEMIKGNKTGARKLIQSYMSGLDEAEALLSADADKEMMRLSPMPECRYLMGTLFEENGRDLLVNTKTAEEGRKSLREALIHFCSVIIKYPSSSWAMEAKKRVDGIVRLAKEKGWKPPTLPAFDNSQFAAEQLKEARLLFQNNDFPAAAEKYREVLSVYYDRPGMVSAVGELARCYIETETTERNPPYYSRAVAGYVADRYCKSTNLYEEAGDTLLLIAGAFETRADRESADRVHDMYFEKYSNHKRAVKAVLHRAAVALRATNYVDALKYYQLIAQKYTNSPSAVDAVGLTADCFARLGDHTNAIAWFSNYVAKLPWSIEEAIAIRKMADEYQAIGRFVPALNEYNRLVYLLTNRGDKIDMTRDNETRKQDTLEWAMYQKASCYSKLKTPQDRIASYQTNAINAYTEFINRFRKSEIRAPRALGALAVLYSIQGKQKDADDMFQRLQAEWPNDEYVKNIIYMRVDNLLALGRVDEAMKAASGMLDKPDAYTAEQFTKIGDLMLTGKMYAEACKALALGRRSTNSNTWELASFDLGRAFFEMGRFEEAMKPLEEMLVRNRRSAYTLEANRMLSRCYAEAGKKEVDPAKQLDCFNKAYKAMNRLRPLIKPEDKKGKMEVELELATIQVLQGKKNGAAATCQRVFMFGDSADPSLRPLMEKAFESGTLWLKELEKYEDVRDNCESYLRQFPDGFCVGRAKDWLEWAKIRLGGQP